VRLDRFSVDYLQQHLGNCRIRYGRGAEEYYLSVFASIVVVVVLTLFGYVQSLIDRYQKAIHLRLQRARNRRSNAELQTRLLKIREMKKGADSVFNYKVWGPEKHLNNLLDDLQGNCKIRSFEY
jgi:hypothetical protein